MTVPVVFAPGSLCDGRLFHDQIVAVGDAMLADLNADESIEAMAERLLRDAPSRFALVGLSLGGIVAAEVVRQAPLRVAGLALIDTNLDAPNVGQLETRRRWAAEVRSGHFPLVVAELLPQMTACPAEHGALITKMALAAGPAAFLRQNAALLQRSDRRPSLSSIEVPTLVACGALDTVCPPTIHADLADRTPHARLAVVVEAGHLSTIDQPAALTSALMDWLKLCNNHQPRKGTTHECTTE